MRRRLWVRIRAAPPQNTPARLVRSLAGRGPPAARPVLNPSMQHRPGRPEPSTEVSLMAKSTKDVLIQLRRRGIVCHHVTLEADGLMVYLEQSAGQHEQAEAALHEIMSVPVTISYPSVGTKTILRVNSRDAALRPPLSR